MQTLLGIFLIALASQFVAPFFALLNVLISFFCYRMMVYSSFRRERLDQLFSEYGWSQKRLFEPGYYPADGWHFMFKQGGMMIAQKTTLKSERNGDEKFYEVYIFGYNLYEWLKKNMRGDVNTIDVKLCITPTIWRLETYIIPRIIKYHPYEWQKHVLCSLTKLFEEQEHASLLLWGDSGAGKSEIAYFINKKIMQESNVEIEPITVEADITKRGLCLSDLCVNPLKERPIILLLNELDSIILHAENETDANSDGMSLAGTKTSLLNTLDQINRFPNVILIATMNANPDVIPLVYRRPGRFDLILEAK